MVVEKRRPSLASMGTQAAERTPDGPLQPEQNARGRGETAPCGGPRRLDEWGGGRDSGPLTRPMASPPLPPSPCPDPLFPDLPSPYTGTGGRGWGAEQVGFWGCGHSRGVGERDVDRPARAPLSGPHPGPLARLASPQAATLPASQSVFWHHECREGWLPFPPGRLHTLDPGPP